MISREDQIRHDAWIRIASILKINCEDISAKNKLHAASMSWLEYAGNDDNIAPSADLKNNLAELNKKCGEVIDLINKTKDHHLINAVLHHNNMRKEDADTPSPFGEMQIGLLLQLQSISRGLQRDIVIERGPKGDVPKYISWTMAADIYEINTGRNAYFSRKPDGEMAYDFYDFILAFCQFTYPGCRESEASIEAFSKRRAAVKSKGRDPLLEAMGIPIRISVPN